MTQLSDFIRNNYSSMINRDNFFKTSTDEIYQFGTVLQRCFWDFNDNHAEKIGARKFHNLTLFCQVLCPDVEHAVIHDFVDMFQEVSRVIPVAGVIPLNSLRDSILLVKNISSNVWSFPKGKFESNIDKSLMECAQRECYEEIGHRVDLSELTRYHPLEFTIGPRKATFYKIICDQSVDYQPTVSNEIAEVRWHKISDIRLFPRQYNAHINRAIDQGLLD